MHHADRREELRDGADRVEGGGGGGLAGLAVGVPVPGLGHHVLVVDEGHGDPGDLLVRHLRVEPHLEQIHCLFEARVDHQLPIPAVSVLGLGDPGYQKGQGCYEDRDQARHVHTSTVGTFARKLWRASMARQAVRGLPE